MRLFQSVIIFICANSVVFGQVEKNFIDQNYVEVNGRAEMEIVPDLIYIKIKISEKDPKNKAAIDQTEKLMLEKLQAISIDVTKDLTVNDLSSSFKNHFLSKADIILAKEYQLVVRDGKTASKVFIELEKIGISNTSIDRVDHTKILDFRKEVKVNAIKAAQEKAYSLAHAISQNIGRALFIQEAEYTPINYNYAANNAYTFRDTAAVHRGDSYETTLDFEKIKLESTILVRFELK
jgi:uncharacterized protein YggE